jgi:hypothetical protein
MVAREAQSIARIIPWSLARVRSGVYFYSQICKHFDALFSTSAILLIRYDSVDKLPKITRKEPVASLRGDSL